MFGSNTKGAKTDSFNMIYCNSDEKTKCKKVAIFDATRFIRKWTSILTDRLLTKIHEEEDVIHLSENGWVTPNSNVPPTF